MIHDTVAHLVSGFPFVLAGETALGRCERAYITPHLVHAATIF